MKKVLIISLFLICIFQARSQNTEVELYLVQCNSIVKGTLEESSGDSLRIRVDSLHTLAYAKTELEGNDLPVSNDVKKLRRELIRNEYSKTRALFPGIYQIRNGAKVKGKIIFVLVTIGIIGVVGSVGVYAAGLAVADGLLGLFSTATNTMLVLAPSAVLSAGSKIWDLSDQHRSIKNRVNSRYYFRGEIPKGLY
ncbi:MAG: hypothetical protein H6Q18_384 [Bacteroidetes bacterium]|nr:hypothetical protein [Bacteroidota bacterium]